MTDFFGFSAPQLFTGTDPGDPNAGQPKNTAASIGGGAGIPYPSVTFDPSDSTVVPSLYAPFERVDSFLVTQGVDPGDPDSLGPAENGSHLQGLAALTGNASSQRANGALDHAGYLDPFLQRDWFEKWHVFPGELALGNVLTTQIRELEIFNAFRNESRTWQGFTNNAGAGITITNLPSLPTVLEALESFDNDVQGSTAGPPVINGTLDFDVDLVPPDVIIVPITGNRITIFQFRPQSPIKEELGFKTNVLQHTDGSEQRLSLRQAPRQKMEFTIRVDDGRSRDAINAILFDWQARVFGVPIWWEAKPLDAPLTALDTVVQVDTADADFRAGGLVTIYDSNFVAQTVEILTVNPTNLVLQVAIGTAFDAINTLVLPTRTAYTKPQLQDARFAIGPADYKFEFTVLDNIDLSDASAFPSYQGVGQSVAKPLLDGLNFMPSGTIAEGNRQRTERLDHETGPFIQFSSWEKGKPLYTYGFEAKSFADTWNVRQLLHYLRGSQLSFYVPTGRTDIKPLADIANNDSSINFVDYGFDQFVQGVTPRSDLRVLRTDGTYSMHTITGTSVVSPGVERVDFSPGITPALLLVDLDRIEIVTLSRLVNDRARFVHRRPGETRIDIPLIGVPA